MLRCVFAICYPIALLSGDLARPHPYVCIYDVYLCVLVICNYPQLEEFKQHLPLIQCLRNPGMKDRHWNEIRAKTGASSLSLFVIFLVICNGHATQYRWDEKGNRSNRTDADACVCGRKTDLDLKPTPALTLSGVLAKDVSQHIETLTSLADKASKEYSLERALQKMMQEWHKILFDCFKYKYAASATTCVGLGLGWRIHSPICACVGGIL